MPEVAQPRDGLCLRRRQNIAAVDPFRVGRAVDQKIYFGGLKPRHFQVKVDFCANQFAPEDLQLINFPIGIEGDFVVGKCESGFLLWREVGDAKNGHGLQARHPGALHSAMADAKTLGLQVRFLEVGAPTEFEAAFGTVVQEQIQVLLILADPMFFANSEGLAELSVKSRLITMTAYRTLAEAGALMSYGPNYFDSYKAAASYVDRILKGSKPADLPIDQSSRFEFVVNMKTAKMLGVEIPTSVLGFATEVIE
jgi:ABC transporter substrate binding protein